MNLSASVLQSCLLLSVIAPPLVPAQSPTPALENFNFEDGAPLKIVREAIPSRPFSVVGPRGTLLGQQDGTFEAWIFPWKVFRDFRIQAQMQDYPVPIDVNEHAAVIEVRPDHTTITFAHANFTIREVFFAPHHAPDGAGVLAFFQIQAIRPMTLTFQFTPELSRMWPAESDGYSSAEWVKTNDGGFYALHTNFPDAAAAVEMPGAAPGILPPYQERSKSYPAQFILRFDPARDSAKLFPLLLTVAQTPETASNAGLGARLNALATSVMPLYENNSTYYRNFLTHHLSIVTPDPALNEALAWAEVSIDQLKVETTPAHDETALAAGFISSGDSARPGFGAMNWNF
jgi:hypothetical protein